ncbi:MAG: NUDIX domain-containing protein [Coriobacteriales bacterium]|jgi:ADP-ribose pyrophosphatase
MGLIEHEDIPDLEETILGSERVYDGKLLHVDRVAIEHPDGRRTHHEVIRHPGAVGIVALDGKGNILLVHQYRTALERITIEIPAGKIDRGEDPLESAKRELSEETGYEAREIRYLTPVATSVGYTDEIVHLYLATDLVPGPAHPDSGEFLAVEWVPLNDLIDSVLDARIEDSKTIIAALICDALRTRIEL